MFLAWVRVIGQTVITLAGGNTTGTTSGKTNGVGTAALFYFPFGVAVDTSGNVIVADSPAESLTASGRPAGPLTPSIRLPF